MQRIFEGMVVDIHHRIPKSKTSDHRGGCEVEVPKHKHECWHALFENKNPTEIADLINKYWLDPNFTLIAVPTERVKRTMEILKQVKNEFKENK